jgi:predicted ATPase
MFRIIQFEIKKHNFFKPQKFKFTDDNDLNPGPYVTLLIGPNGTGKSQLLESLVKIFNTIVASKERGFKVQNFENDFFIEYQIGTDIVTIDSVKNNNLVYLNGNEIDMIDVPTPSKILASANNLGDRFPFLTNRNKTKNSKYEYLGIRTASNNAFKNYNNLIDRFSSSLLKTDNLKRYEHIFDLLGLKPEITIIYKLGKNFTINKTIDDREYLTNDSQLGNKFDSIISKIESKGRFLIRKDKYSKVISDPENLKLISSFFSSIDFPSSTKKNIKYESNIEFKDLSKVTFFKEESKVLRLIRDLELFDVEKLILHRKKSKYTFDQASSGEHHILSGFINLISTIENNSVVFIDEPEISLHPNWQIKYMNLLQSTFKEFSNCHFIISTHSHFLVSDLVPNKSAIISFQNNDKGEVFNETLEFDAYGWSTENVLYRVFGVSTARNHYLEMDLRELLSLISHNSDRFERMDEIINSLKKFQLTSDDPLLKIIKTAENYLEKNGY